MTPSATADHLPTEASAELGSFKAGWHQAMLVTDGSGHKDGDGGYAAHLLWAARGAPGQAMGAATDTGVYRMEFTGLLEGLKMIADRFDLWRSNSQEYYRLHPIIVWWVGDNESLINCVKRKPDGTTVYARKSEPDLWCRFAFFEQFMYVDAHHAGRECNLMKPVDWYASTLRVVIKNVKELHPWTEHRHNSEE